MAFGLGLHWCDDDGAGRGGAGKVPACLCTYRMCLYCRVHNVDAKKTASFVEFVWPRLLLFLEYSVIGLKR